VGELWEVWKLGKFGIFEVWEIWNFAGGKIVGGSGGTAGGLSQSAAFIY